MLYTFQCMLLIYSKSSIHQGTLKSCLASRSSFFLHHLLSSSQMTKILDAFEHMPVLLCTHMKEDLCQSSLKGCRKQEVDQQLLSQLLEALDAH